MKAHLYAIYRLGNARLCIKLLEWRIARKQAYARGEYMARSERPEPINWNSIWNGIAIACCALTVLYVQSH